MRKVTIIISQEMLDAGNVLRLATFLSPALIPSECLEASCGSLQMRLRCERKEAGQPYAQPAVRAYLQRLHRAWPYGPYFCELRGEFLFALALSQLQRLVVVEAENARTAIRFHTCELKHFLKQGRASIRELGVRGGMPPVTIRKRQRDLLQYFAKRLQILPH